MDQQQIQRTRYILQSRFRRIRNAKLGHFELICAQTLNWLESHPIFSSVIKYLENVQGLHHQEIENLKNLYIEHNFSDSRYRAITVDRYSRQEHEKHLVGYTPTSVKEHASVSLDILKACITIPNLGFYDLLSIYLIQQATQEDSLDLIKDYAVKELYEYLDEYLDSINSINGLLRKYKQNVEWFERTELRSILEHGLEGKTGERALAIHLQKYIFNQGVEFSVEPSSRSGEADLVLHDSDGNYVIIDAKFVKNGSSKSEITKKIASGLHQVARYCSDYNQPEGFLAVYLDDDVSIDLESERNDTFSFIKIGSVVVYYVEINVAELPSASKAGVARQILIKRDELIQTFEHITD